MADETDPTKDKAIDPPANDGGNRTAPVDTSDQEQSKIDPPANDGGN